MAQSSIETHRPQTAPSALARSPQGLSIGFKIFGIATSLLALLIFVVATSANRLRRVNEEITALADYALPITDLVAEVDVHALEQELHFERIQYLYEIEPPPLTQIRSEKQKFENRGEAVDQELRDAIELTQLALAQPQITTHRDEWAKVAPMLTEIEAEHQRFQSHAVTILEHLEAGDLETARQLGDQLIEEEENFNQAINEIFLELEAFTVRAAQSGQRHQQTVQTLSIVTAAIATGFGLCYAFLITVGLVRPVRNLTRSLQAVRDGNLDTQLEVTSRDEVGTLARAFNGMMQEIRLKARLEDTFGKYVDPRIVRSLMTASTETAIAGERQVMTVFFADLAGVSTFAESLPPDDLVQFINTYLSLLAAPVSTHDGVIDKFIGTMVMGFWGPPFSQDRNHAVLACEAAIAQRNCLDSLQQLMAKFAGDRPIPDLHLTIGIATGALVVGNMGSDSAKSYTVMGDTVNTASRLKGSSKQYDVPILMTGATQTQVAEVMETREIDLIQVLGKEEPIRIYELLGHKGTTANPVLTVRDTFEQGLTAYRNQQWNIAQSHFEACLALLPSDRPAALFLERLELLRQNPPGEDWQGIWQLTEK
ncbi:MAG: adenylate/guanylate cyclase domain-containing protein [Cyanobacteria bacterium P01_A01_bin.123]